MVAEDLEPLARAVRDGSGAARVLLGSRARGKTTALWRLGETASVRVLRAIGIPRGEPFSLLRQLLDGTAALDAGDLHRVRREFWDFLRRQPTLLLVDDAHWSDPQSARVLADAARRARGHPVGVVLAASTEHPLHEELEQLPALELTGVDESDARSMLDESGGPGSEVAGSGAQAPPSVLTELVARCEANPLVLREFIATLSADQVRGRVPLPRQVVLGSRSLRVFGDSWSHLPPETRTWLAVLALGPPELTTCLRAARALELDLDELAPAERAGVVRLDGGVVWSSPLVRAAVRQSMMLADTARVCSALAEAVDPAEWPVEHARYLAGALVDPEQAASALASTTVLMARAGRLLDAYEAVMRATELTSDRAARERFRITAAELAWLAGYSEHALDLLDRAEPERSEEARTSAVIMRAVIHGFRESWVSGWWLLPTDPGQERGSAQHGVRLLVTALVAGWENASVASLQRVVTRLRDGIDPAADPVPGALAALERVLAGHSDLTSDERKALRALAWWAVPSDALHPKAWPPPLLPAFLGEEDRYAHLCAELLRGEPVRAAHSTRALLLLKLASAQSVLGHWDHALDNAARGARLAAELGHHALHSDLLLSAAWIAAARGDEQAGSHHLDIAVRHEGRVPSGRQPLMTQWIRGLAALSDGRPDEAFERLRELRHGTGSPHQLTLRRLSTVDLVEAAVQAHRQEEAEELVADFAEWAGSGAAPWVRLDLARCRALLGGADAEQWHRQAVELSAEVGRVFSSARTEFHFGAWLRRHKRYQEAREHLRTAEEHFDRLGATAWSRRAHAELRASGETRNPQPRHELTPQERRIALLAADGLTNRQIADKLSLSPRTVGYHLYKIFPKLDITSRAQLASVLEPDR